AREEREGVLGADGAAGAVLGAVDALVGAAAAEGEDVLVPDALDVDEGALPGAVGPVLEGRERDEVVVGEGHRRHLSVGIGLSAPDGRPPVVADGWVVRAVRPDELDLLPAHFLIRSRL